MSHQEVENIHVICTDPRIQKFYHDWLNENNLWGKFDTIEHENPILSFLDPQSVDIYLDRIGNYIKLHHPQKVILIDHTNCGAYHLHGYNFDDLENELIVHNKNNKHVVELITKQYPDLKVEIKIIHIDSNNQCHWL